MRPLKNRSFASTRYRPLLRVYNCRRFRYAAGSCCLNVKAKGMGLLIKALLGALVVVLIGVLSKTKNYYIAGLIPLFPTFALIANYIVASERGIEALRTTIVFGMWSIIPYFIYLLSLWYFTGVILRRLKPRVFHPPGAAVIAHWPILAAAAGHVRPSGSSRALAVPRQPAARIQLRR